MSIRVNGKEHSFAPGQRLEALLGTLGLARQDVAVAVDGTVVPRSRWADEPVPDGATVEVVTAMQGG